MRKIFIDTNIYLGFYNTNQPEFKKLLGTLSELKSHLLVTRPVIDEINRNKLNVFRLSVDNYIKAAAFTSPNLPEHLDSEIDRAFQDWNKRRKEIERMASALNKELDDILQTKLSAVATSADKVSMELKKIFASPLPYSDKVYKNASMRKSLGNPPGKPEDPLGDQLNWVQLLENCEHIKKLWFISNDRDFYTEFNNHFFLNPFLHEELKNINPHIEVRIFNKLSAALKDFNEEQQLKTLPEKAALDQIAEEEKTAGVFSVGTLAGSRQKFYGGGYAVPTSCPSCDHKDTLKRPGRYILNKYGLLSYHLTCVNCGYQYDTGYLGSIDEGNGPLWTRDR